MKQRRKKQRLKNTEEQVADAREYRDWAAVQASKFGSSNGFGNQSEVFVGGGSATPAGCP